jgi:hypothetical protein
LLSALTATRLRRLAARRPAFDYLVNGIDRCATLSFDSSWAPESRKAALRVVQTGGAITQSIAARWVHGGKLCPYCKLAVEDTNHRFWACPRWYYKRVSTLGTYTRRALADIVGEQSLLTGIFPSDPALVAAQLAAELLPLGLLLVSCLMRSGLMAVASCLPTTWAVVGYPEQGYPTLACAQVIGRQTIGRAELSAVVWVSMCGSSTSIVDAQYLLRCIARCAEGRPPAALLDSSNGDLWRLLLRANPCRWVKAHLTAEQAPAHNVSERDRLGNDAADIACSSFAATLALHPEVVSARRQYLEAAQVTLSVLAVIQEQALEVQRKSGRVVIKSRRPRRLQRTRAKAKARPGKPARIDLQLPTAPRSFDCG